jgi:hypothetical protein
LAQSVFKDNRSLIRYLYSKGNDTNKNKLKGRIKVSAKIGTPINQWYIRGYALTPSQKHAFVRNACNFSSLVGLVGTLRASRVDAEELKYSNHLILAAGDALAVAINCNFSRFSSGAIE